MVVIMIGGSKNAIVNWLWNFRVGVLLKGAVPNLCQHRG